MPQIGPAEILVILLVGLLVFGPKRLPEIGRQVGRAMREVKKFQDTVKGELDEVLHFHEDDSASAPAYSSSEAAIAAAEALRRSPRRTAPTTTMPRPRPCAVAIPAPDGSAALGERLAERRCHADPAAAPPRASSNPPGPAPVALPGPRTASDDLIRARGPEVLLDAREARARPTGRCRSWTTSRSCATAS